ncbi:MAG: sigma-70 family RNA polymerase sigma factor [Solirubrobacteraceae bacterium]|nr:sigma-70 family RNA polymerase sigma factor [Solirubrobacteraceae bacterium]
MPQPGIRTALHSSTLRLHLRRPADEGAVERAFTQQYDRHHQAIYGYCRSILRHDADAQDALQTTMLKALAAMRDGTVSGDLRPWLFRVAHNEAISMLRRRRETAPLGAADEPATDQLHQRVDDRAALARLQADLEDLAERQRAALVLREFSGLGHEEIAAVLGCSTGAVKQTIFEARKALLDCEAGRSMSCDEIQRTLSDHDGRSLRARKVRAHVRDCAACTAFLAALDERPRQLALLAPAVPAVAGAGLLAQVLGGTPAASTAGTAGAVATGGGMGLSASTGAAASTVATSIGLKAAVLLAAGGIAAGGGVAIRDQTQSQAPAPAARTSAPAPANVTSPGSAPATTRSGTATTPAGEKGRARSTSRAVNATTPEKAARGAEARADNPTIADEQAPGRATSAAARAKGASNGKSPGEAAKGAAKSSGRSKSSQKRTAGSQTPQGSHATGTDRSSAAPKAKPSTPPKRDAAPSGAAGASGGQSGTTGSTESSQAASQADASAGKGQSAPDSPAEGAGSTGKSTATNERSRANTPG